MYKDKSQAIDKTTKGEQLFNLKSDFKSFTNRIFFFIFNKKFFFSGITELPQKELF